MTMISLFILLSFINLSLAAKGGNDNAGAVETCDQIAPCLDITTEYEEIEEVYSAKICVTYDSTSGGCIKGGDPDGEHEAISHACGGYCTPEQELASDCKVENMTSNTQICNDKPCDDANKYIEFGFKDGKGCAGGGNPATVVTIDGVDKTVQCRAADETLLPDEDAVLCAGGNHDECIFTIPYQCPTLSPTADPTADPTIDPTTDPTKKPVEESIVTRASCEAEIDQNEGLSDVDKQIKRCECNGYDANGGKTRFCQCLTNGGTGRRRMGGAPGGLCNPSGGSCGSSGDDCTAEGGGGAVCPPTIVCCCSPYTVEHFENDCNATGFGTVGNTCNFREDAYIFTQDYRDNGGNFNALDEDVDLDTEAVGPSNMNIGIGAYDKDGEETPTGSEAAMSNGELTHKNAFGMEDASEGETVGIWFVIVIGIIILFVGALFIWMRMKQKRNVSNKEVIDLKALHSQSPESPEKEENIQSKESHNPTQITFTDENNDVIKSDVV